MLETKVIEHYQEKNIPRKIHEYISSDSMISLDDLNTYDEFHIGGREATRSLISHFAIDENSLLLDVGCGIGGPARYISSLTNAAITGIDLTPEFIQIAKALTDKTGLSGQVTYECANALDLPFEDLTYDGALMFHVGMNISNKGELYKQVFRKLKPGGFFGIYDIFGNDRLDEFKFPVPWAKTQDTSFLTDISLVQDILIDTGFLIKEVKNKQTYALKTFSENEDLKLRESKAHTAPNKFADKLANLAFNVENSHCAPWEVVCFKPE